MKQGLSVARRSIARLLALALVASLWAGFPTWNSPAVAVSGTTSTSGAKQICGNDTIYGLDTSHRYASVWVPKGADMRLHPSGELMPSTYVGSGRAEYTTHAAVWIGGTSAWSDWNIMSLGVVSGGGPYDWMPADSGSDLHWTNDTGVSQFVGLDLWAERSYAGGGIRWQTPVTVSGGSTGEPCSASAGASAFFGPNPSAGQQCPSCHGGTDYSVDSLSGNEHWVMPGAKLQARGPGIDFQMAYNSLAADTSSSIGYGWHDSFDMSLAQDASGNVTVVQETGSTVPFAQVVYGSGESFASPQIFDSTLVHNSDGTWLFARRHREYFTFDSSGRLTKIADRNGYATTLTYGSSGLDHVVDDAGHRMNVAWTSGQVSSITDVSDGSSPRTMQFTYDSTGNLTGFGDIGGGSWTMTYDGSHRLQTVQSPRFANTSTLRQFHYDGQGRVDWEQDPAGRRTNLYYDDPQAGSTRIVDPAGNARVDAYNALGQRTAVTTGYGTPSASTTTYTYSPTSGMVTDRTDGNGHHWTSTFGDAQHPFLPTKTTDPLGRVRRMTYTADGDLASMTDAHGATSSYAYDANGNPTVTTIADGTPDASTTKLVYGNTSQPGQPTSMVDARGKSWTFGYDGATGELTRLTDPAGNATTWTYNPEGWVRTRVSPRGNASGATPADYTTTYGYDAYGNIATVTDPLGNATRATYDADGNLATRTDATNRQTAYSYTAAGQPATVTVGSGTPDAKTATYTYWPDGNLKTYAVDPAKVWTTYWDPAGRVVKTTDPDGHATTHSYDAAGNLQSTTTAANTADAATTTTTYDDDNRPTSVKSGDGSGSAITTTSGYDVPAGTAPCTGGPAGTVYCTTSTTGNATTVRFFNARGAMVQLARPGGNTTTYTYDGAGSVLTTTDPAGNVTTRTYDAIGNLATSKDGSAPDDTTYTYDANGNRSTMTDSTGTTAYSYDAADRLQSVTDGAGAVVAYAHDEADRLKSLTYPDGRVVSYGRDGAGQVSTLTDDTAAAGGLSTTFGYSPDGIPTNVNLPSGNGITTSLNNEDLPTTIALRNASGSSLVKLDYAYDNAGRVASETDTGGQAGGTSYAYDPTGRLASSTDASTGGVTNYAFDATGNPTQLGATSQTFDASSQLQSSTTGASQTAYGYDANGNLTGVTPATGPASKYSYSRSNRMLTSTTPSAATHGSLYHPVAASRLADTSGGTGYCDPSPCTTLPAGGSITIDVSGHAGIPSSGVNAVTLSITTANNTANGYVLAYPNGSPQPDGRSMSVINGTTQSDTVLVKVGDGGKVVVYSSRLTDVLVDVTGWYSDPANAPNSGDSAFMPINGTRILDTRSSTTTGTCTPSPCARLAAGATTTVQVAGKGGVPNSGVAAVAFTLSAFNPDADGYAIAWPSDAARPYPRSMSFTASTNSSDLVVVPLSGTGKLKLYTYKGSDFTLDLAGYYTTSPDGTGSYFVPYDASSAPKQRVLDTRNGTGVCAPAGCGLITHGNGNGTSITIAGQGPVPASGATGVVLSATVWNPTATTGLVAWPADAAKPNGRNMSYVAGQTTSGTLDMALSAQGAIKAATLAGDTDLTLDVEGWYQSIGTTTQTYTYDGDGLRTSKTDTATGRVTKFSYDTSTPVPHLLTDGKTDYIYSPTGALLESAPTRGSPGGRSYYLTDAIGSTRAISDANGGVTGSYRYSPFGTVASHDGADVPLQYTGGYADSDTGLTYLINRYYNPANGVFTTVDPALDITNQPYSYADNNPINQTDPTGDCPWCVAVAAGFVTGAGIDLGMQVAANLIAGCPAFNNISWGEVATSGLIGAAIPLGGESLAALMGPRSAVRAIALADEIGNSVRAAESASSGAESAITAAETVPKVLKGPIADAVPKNLPQQMALDAAKQGYGRQIMGPMNDAPRLIANYGEGEWVKMQYVLRGNNSNVTVHYFRNLDTGMDVEFKFP